MDWMLELVTVPVTDVDRAKRFYSEQVGFVVDHDTPVSDDMRVVQLTPPGSACSIALGTGIVDTPPGRRRACSSSCPISRPPGLSWSSGAFRSARSSTSTALTGLMGEAGTGTHSSSSAIPTATAGRCRRDPPATEA